MMKRVYTRAEAEKIVKYIVDKKAYGLVKGNKLWKEMEASQILNRTWQSLKQYYSKKIISRLNGFDLTEDEKDNFREGFYKVKINKHPEKKIHLQIEFSDEECFQEKENTSQNIYQDFWIDTEPSTSKSFEREYIKEPRISKRILEPNTSKSIEREYIPEPSTSKSIEREYIPEPSTSNSIEREYIPETSTSKSIKREYIPEPSTSKSIEREYIPKPSTSKSIEIEYIPELSTSKSIEIEYFPEPSTSKSIEIEYIPELSTSKSIEIEYFPEPSTSKSIKEKNIEDMNAIDTIVIDSDSNDSSASTYCGQFEHTELGVHLQQDNRKEFSLAEDLRLIKIITKDPEYLDYIDANVIYKFLSNSAMFNKTWTQLKDRFLNHILPNIKKYNCLEIEEIISIFSKTGKPVPEELKKYFN